MFLELCLGVLSLLIALRWWLTRHYDYWEKTGVPYVQPSLIFGNLKDIILMRKNTYYIYDDFYKKFPNEPAVGLYKMRHPQLFVRDPELVKTVMVKEFNSFHDNDFSVDPEFDPILGNNPFATKGERWKIARAIHTPALTTNKLKSMVPLISDVCKDMVEFVSKNLEKPLEAKYFCGQYTTDVVASCVYGLASNSFKDPNAVFRKMSQKVFASGIKTHLVFILASVAPSLATLLNLRFLPKDVTDFFHSVVRDAMTYRKANSVTRNDFLQHLMVENSKHDKPVYSDDEVIAFTMTFFFDGYETSSILISNTLDFLAWDQDSQNRLREELVEATKEKGLNGLDYDVLTQLPFLDAVISEALRIGAPASVLTKVCTKDIKLECKNREYQMKKGMTVSIPIYSIHMDPTYFPDPEEFRPERFLESSTTHEGYFPFGMGPRACLGSRFALTQSKMAVASLVLNYQILPRDETRKKRNFEKSVGVLLVQEGGLWIKFRKIEPNIK